MELGEPELIDLYRPIVDAHRDGGEVKATPDAGGLCQQALEAYNREFQFQVGLSVDLSVPSLGWDPHNCFSVLGN